MSRIRSVKPEFFKSEQVVNCSIPARLLFIGLWNIVDDAGRYERRPKQIKMEVFPYDDVSEDDMRKMLDELEKNGLIAFYEVAGAKYLRVIGWRSSETPVSAWAQRIDKPQPPRYPSPPEPALKPGLPQNEIRDPYDIAF